MAGAMDKDEIARVRALPLEAVLQRLGATRDPKDPAHNWRLGASRITVTDERFYDHNGAGALHRVRGGRGGGRGPTRPVGCPRSFGSAWGVGWVWGRGGRPGASGLGYRQGCSHP